MASCVRTIVAEAYGDYIVCELVPCESFACKKTHLFSCVFDARENSKDINSPARLTLTYCDIENDFSGAVYQLEIDNEFIQRHFLEDVGLESTMHAYSGHFGRTLNRQMKLDSSFATSLATGSGVVIECAYYIGGAASADEGTKLVGALTLPLVQRTLDVRVCQQIHSLTEYCARLKASQASDMSNIKSSQSPIRAGSAPISDGRVQDTVDLNLTADPTAIQYELLEEEHTESAVQDQTGQDTAASSSSAAAGLAKAKAKRRRIGGVNLVVVRR